MNKVNKALRSIIIVFVLVNIIVLISKNFLLQYNFNIRFLLVANCVLFMISIFSFFIQRKALMSSNPHAFVRGVYSSMLIKLFVCIIAITIYIVTSSGKVNQPALFTSMGLYILYTAVEVSGSMKALQKKDA